jgi:hypothetical protein
MSARARARLRGERWMHGVRQIRFIALLEGRFYLMVKDGGPYVLLDYLRHRYPCAFLMKEIMTDRYLRAAGPSKRNATDHKRGRLLSILLAIIRITKSYRATAERQVATLFAKSCANRTYAYVYDVIINYDYYISFIVYDISI